MNKVERKIEKLNKKYGIGTWIGSVIPLDDDYGLHLLDGSIIQGDGIYKEFVEYVVSRKDSHRKLFTNEIMWHLQVWFKGYCTKFVYNPKKNTLRLPKIKSTYTVTN